MRARVLLVVATVLVVLAADTGCLSIHGMKDLLVLQKTSAPLVYRRSTPVSFTWEANGVLRPDTLQESRNIMVKPGTRSLTLTYKVAIVSGQIARLLNITLPTTPLVTLRLRSPAGDVYWEGNFTESASSEVPAFGPSAGTWVLRMEAKGYGIDQNSIDIHDTFQVEVTLYEPK